MVSTFAGAMIYLYAINDYTDDPLPPSGEPNMDIIFQGKSPWTVSG